MSDTAKRLQIAILLYPGVTALDAVGPLEVLSRMPDTDVRFVGKEVGPVTRGRRASARRHPHARGNSFARSWSSSRGGTNDTGADGGRRSARVAAQGARDNHLDCVGLHGRIDPRRRRDSERACQRRLTGTRWACSRSWAPPAPDERIVHPVRSLRRPACRRESISRYGSLARSRAERAEAIQLVIEYDPHPPFERPHEKGVQEARKVAKQMMDESMPADQRRLVPKIAWRRFIDLVRTGK